MLFSVNYVNSGRNYDEPCGTSPLNRATHLEVEIAYPNKVTVACSRVEYSMHLLLYCKVEHTHTHTHRGGAN